ncbi:hypothetical protein A3K93_07780 [Acinetobacter sp. NCu2D-2]|uniref:hypothetical protein n=1 Tax=Acinetobacter sp. NCu2D-2 TaxID=1608473 RepID=UPI0007CDD5B8|nr:hypothetical protein [Acinetobacter sp. NCu2D-2]ANF83137.1 hypothetical protein A3K93_07780 [Acinetobacter sp. NCu2D-2]
MKKMIDIKVKDQYSKVVDAKAVLRDSEIESLELPKLVQKIEHVVIGDEIILPSIELLFESQNTPSIYRVIEAN